MLRGLKSGWGSVSRGRVSSTDEMRIHSDQRRILGHELLNMTPMIAIGLIPILFLLEYTYSTDAFSEYEAHSPTKRQWQFNALMACAAL